MTKKTHNNNAVARRTFITTCSALTLAVMAVAPFAAQAQEAALTGKKVRLVVPFSPGGGVDGLARALAEGLSRQAGVSVIVDNKPGAGGNIAASYVAKTQNDTLNLLVTSVNHYANKVLFRSPGYEPYKDFTPIGYLSTFPYAFVVPGDSRFNTMAEVIAEARAKPGTVSWGFGGNGSLGHFLGVAMEQAENVKGNPIAYRGGPDLLTALGGKQVDMVVMTVQSSTPLVRQGRLKALAVAGAQRNKVLPNVPSINETIPNYPPLQGYVALMAPVDTPEPVLAAVHRELNKLLVSDDYKKRLDQDGSTAILFPTVAATKAFFDKDGPQWEALTAKTGLKVE
ncbi:MAG: tripartite tricarboxylate transporter substrate binding protein [Burkholderiales bacterium]|nr:MAG: tripartite tricarboxylate transporter substrate binding protein [Burkholderiales bacterium]